MNSIALHKIAHEAGMAAGYAIQPKAMVVSGMGQEWVVSEGPCGFAWIIVSGNTKFGRDLTKEGIGSKGYPSGVHIRVHAFNQSWERKVAYAKAYAQVLNENGVKASWGERLD